MLKRSKSYGKVRCAKQVFTDVSKYRRALNSPARAATWTLIKHYSAYADYIHGRNYFRSRMQVSKRQTSYWEQVPVVSYWPNKVRLHLDQTATVQYYPLKVLLIKLCLHETFREARTSKYLSDIFPSQNGRTRKRIIANACNCALECASTPGYLGPCL
jgi:hypothetical protein